MKKAVSSWSLSFGQLKHILQSGLSVTCVSNSWDRTRCSAQIIAVVMLIPRLGYLTIFKSISWSKYNTMLSQYFKLLSLVH